MVADHGISDLLAADKTLEDADHVHNNGLALSARGAGDEACDVFKNTGGGT